MIISHRIAFVKFFMPKQPRLTTKALTGEVQNKRENHSAYANGLLKQKTVKNFDRSEII